MSRITLLFCSSLKALENRRDNSTVEVTGVREEYEKNVEKLYSTSTFYCHNQTPKSPWRYYGLLKREHDQFPLSSVMALCSIHLYLTFGITNKIEVHWKTIVVRLMVFVRRICGRWFYWSKWTGSPLPQICDKNKRWHSQ